MTGQLSRTQALAHKATEQVNHITDAFAEQGTRIRTEFEADGGVGFTYAERQILVRDDYLERVQIILGQPTGVAQVTRVIAGVVLLSLVAAKRPKGKVKVPRGKRPTVIAALRAIDEELGEGIATPDHVLTVAPGALCPATEPQEVYDGTEPSSGYLH